MPTPTGCARCRVAARRLRPSPFLVHLPSRTSPAAVPPRPRFLSRHNLARWLHEHPPLEGRGRARSRGARPRPRGRRGCHPRPPSPTREVASVEGDGDRRRCRRQGAQSIGWGHVRQGGAPAPDPRRRQRLGCRDGRRRAGSTRRRSGSTSPGAVSRPRWTDRFRGSPASRRRSHRSSCSRWSSAVSSRSTTPVGQIVIDHLGVVPSDPDAAAITVRQLLSITPPAWARTNRRSSAMVRSRTPTRYGSGSPVLSTPGEAYTYSNMGYAVLTVFDRGRHRSGLWQGVVSDRLLAPLGFTDMRMTGTFDVGPDEVSHHPTAGRNYMEVLGASRSGRAPRRAVRLPSVRARPAAKRPCTAAAHPWRSRMAGPGGDVLDLHPRSHG